jgi:HAD superfamily hydrolase (TIGR01509 family)
MLPQAIIFDMDGLLIDTETCDYQAWRELHEEHGLELRLPDYCYNAGMFGTWDRMYEDLARHAGSTPQALHDRRRPRYMELVSELLCPSPELLDFLDWLEARSIKRAIASSSETEWVTYLVDGLGIRPRFQAIASGHDVIHRKPAPDLYLLAAQRLGVDPARSVALEDSAHGIQAARAAGMRVITIPNSVSQHQDLSGADARVQHFGEVTPELLERVMG